MDTSVQQPAWTPELLQAPHAAPEKAGRVRRMFNAIAPRYELVNRLFSAGRDAAWRRQAVAMARVRPDDDVLDVACGTGDFARAFAAAGPRRVLGADFAHDMLKLALTHRNASAGDSVRCRMEWCEADALRLPCAAGSFSIVSCAFGVRNFANLDAGLSEMFRVVRPGGRAVILEFTRPQRPWIRSLYEVYSHRIMPVAATWISGDRSGAYRYLPKSITTFLTASEMMARLRRSGFGEVTSTPLTWGVVTVYIARRT